MFWFFGLGLFTFVLICFCIVFYKTHRDQLIGASYFIHIHNHNALHPSISEQYWKRLISLNWSQAALWLTMGTLAFGWIQAVRCRGSETHLLATCLERKVAEGHWMEMSAHTVWEIHVQFGVRRNSPSPSTIAPFPSFYFFDFQFSRHQWSLPICLVNSERQVCRVWIEWAWMKRKQMIHRSLIEICSTIYTILTIYNMQ